jgi:hypothetical protein
MKKYFEIARSGWFKLSCHIAGVYSWLSFHICNYDTFIGPIHRKEVLFDSRFGWFKLSCHILWIYLPRLQLWHLHYWCSYIPRVTCIRNFRTFYNLCLTQTLPQWLKRISVLMTPNRITQRVLPFPISNITDNEVRENAVGFIAYVFYDQSQLSPSVHCLEHT